MESSQPTTNEKKTPFGFLLLRHVSDEMTNQYWNHAIECIRKFYDATIPIWIIDDHSDPRYVKRWMNEENKKLEKKEEKEKEDDGIYVWQSPFAKGKGEILPFYFYLTFREPLFPIAILLHDSMFLQHPLLPFFPSSSSSSSSSSIENQQQGEEEKKETNFPFPVLPLWHFPPDEENPKNLQRMIHLFPTTLRLRLQALVDSSRPVKDNLRLLWNPSSRTEPPASPRWNGCFGCQCVIHRTYLRQLETKFHVIFNLLPHMHQRTDRCTFERILGLFLALDHEETFLTETPSLLGNIFHYSKWGIPFADYMQWKQQEETTNPTGQTFWSIRKPIVKVWTGR